MARFVGIDPSTKTGFVVLDEHGQVLRAKELTGVGSEDPKRMATLIDEVMRHLQPDDVICIEGFGFASQQAIQLGGIGWGIRMALFRRGIPYIDVPPASMKKFATGRGNAKKDEMVLPIYRKWGFEHSSDNVRDAFVLAKIAAALRGDSDPTVQPNSLTTYQAEVLDAIVAPPEKKQKRKKVPK
jgi:crossover junction endodeoxyribonuclease RuvC